MSQIFPYLLYLNLAALLLSGFFLFLFGHRVKRGHWLVSLIYLGSVAYAAQLLLETWIVPPGGRLYPLLLFLGLGIVTAALAEEWNALGQAAFAAMAASAASLVGYTGYVTFTSHLGPLSFAFSIALLLLQSVAMFFMTGHTFEVVDVICRTRWRRNFSICPAERNFPKVSLHLPAYNEPPQMVIQTLDALAKLDYPNYEVIVIDNNTKEESLWRPVEAHCLRLGFKFFHLDNWPGFKSGALNFGLTQTDPEAEIIGVIDSDYVVERNYLKDLIGFFDNPNVAFLQTPQDYRDFSNDDRYAGACYRAYAYFFAVSMASRNERNGIIFAGTMGLIRKRVLEEMGGWDEWCITEDAEISLRILSRGYESVYVDRTYGRGLMPLNFEGLRKQRFRWAFGGMQILRLHWKKLLPWSGRLDPENRLTWGQKADYWLGGLQWLGDPLAFAFTLLLLISSSAFLLARSVFLPPMAVASFFGPPFFILFGVTKFFWALRIRLGCTLREAFDAFMVILGLTWVVTLACLLGLTKKEGVFLRTPKQRGEAAAIRSLQIVAKEGMLLGVCLLSSIGLILSGPTNGTLLLLASLLGWQGFIYGSSLVVSLWSYRSEQKVTDPILLQTSRTTGERFRSMVTDRRAVLGLAAVGGFVAFFFYFSVTLAPDQEKVFRTLPAERPEIPSAPRALINNPPEALIRAKVFSEENAALSKDIDAAVALWSRDGVIRDVNYTLHDESDDRVWRGLDQIRARYEEEFGLRTYVNLSHQNLSMFIEEEKASVVNDLSATIQSAGKKQKVFLSKGDRWTFRKEGDEWKISSLTVNRTPR